MNEDRDISLYEDAEIAALHAEIEKLGIEIVTLENEQAEIEKLLYEFQVRHDRELGELLIKILKCRKETLTNEAKEDNSKQSEAEEAQHDYDSYKNNYEINRKKEIRQLTDEQKQELKNKFREASKLCHPDKVNDVQKEQATTIFNDLKEAYDNNDLDTVAAILENLKQGILTSKTESNEKTELQAQISILRRKRDELIQMLDKLKASETYHLIEQIQDWNIYFESQKAKLEDIWIKMEKNSSSLSYDQ